MDLLYTRRLDGFCLVSSDSDFTRLARASAKQAGGLWLWRAENAGAVRVACDKFIYTEVLRKDAPSPQGTAVTARGMGLRQGQPRHDRVRRCDSRPSGSAESTERWIPARPDPQAIEQGADESGWAHLGCGGELPHQGPAGFRSEALRLSKLSDLLKKYPAAFETETWVGGIAQ